jgi:predicted transcriptional regulator
LNNYIYKHWPTCPLLGRIIIDVLFKEGELINNDVQKLIRSPSHTNTSRILSRLIDIKLVKRKGNLYSLTPRGIKLLN